MSRSEHIRLLIWSSIPTHHQSAFLAALRERRIDVVVHYYQHVETQRLNLGWAAPETLPPGEHYVQESLASLSRCPDWRERIHIVPGYGRLFLLQLAWFLSRRNVAWLHWSEHSRPNPSNVRFVVQRFYGRLVRQHALGALAIGELARREFVQWGIPDERIRFLPYAVQSLGAASVEGASHDASLGTRFLFLGALERRKGIDVLLPAMRAVLAAHPQSRLELVGHDRSSGQYLRQAERLGIVHAVRFTGAVPASDIGAALARCDVLVLPSRHDGWGVVLNEAASLGKAIIATETCGAAHHLVQPGSNGFRIAAGDSAALAQAMRAYCSDPGLAARHGSESLRIFQDFTPSRNAQRFEQALESLSPAFSEPAASAG